MSTFVDDVCMYMYILKESEGYYMSLTPIKAIRAKCLECSAGQYSEVRQCPIADCALYPYRMGHRPKAGSETDTKETQNESISENDQIASVF